VSAGGSSRSVGFVVTLPSQTNGEQWEPEGSGNGPSMPNSSDLTGSNTRVILFFVSPKASIQKNRVKQKACSPKICNHQIRHQLPQKKSKKSTKNI